MNNFVFTILKNGKFVGSLSTSFEKYDINSQIFRIYNSENHSYQDIKITAELLKPKKIEKFTTNRTCSELDFELIDKINEIIDYINKGE